jgi:hypothetical protein
MLGLAHIQWPTGRNEIFGRVLDNAYPRDFLQKDILDDIGIVSPERAFELRQRALEPLREDVLDLMYGTPEGGLLAA